MLTITIEHYLVLSGILFSIGLSGIITNKRHLLINLLCIEVMLLAVNINFVAFSSHLNDLMGQIFTIFVLTIAAAETAIGLAIFIVFFKQTNSINIDDLTQLKG
jgi:NADH-quinone oxidoreductase subunit K